jgi:hypothetical protein
VEHLLEDAWLKISRAKEHFDALHREVREFFEANPCVIATEFDAQTGEQRFSVPAVAFPKKWALGVGDACGNARAALDHMVYALATEGGGQPEQERTAFPIFESKDDYWRVSGRGKRATSTRDRYLVGVEEKWRRKIDDLQPYHRLTNAYADPLAVLADIANRDKHRLLHATHVRVDTPAYEVISTGSDRIGEVRITYNLTTPKQPNVTIDVQAFRGRGRKAAGLAMHPKVEVDDKLGVSVVFGDDLPRMYDLDKIKRTITWTESIIKWFEPAFDPPVTT